ncbi:MAG: dihydrolipoyl dehydrogenase [Anaerolineae bacterium]
MGELDLVVIGGGVGGYVCALRAAQLGLRVALVEKLRLGGVCLNWGCIPTKALLQSVHAYLLARRLAEFGVQVRGTLEVAWEFMIARKNTVVGTLVDGVQNLLAGHHVQVLLGTARITSPRSVEVTLLDRSRVSLGTRHVVIATGSVPARPPIAGLDLPGVVTSDELLALPGVAPRGDIPPLRDLPHRLVVIGGGVIGIEFATLFSALGTQVTVLEMLPRILPPVEAELSKRYRALLKKQGIELVVEARVEEIALAEKGLMVYYQAHRQRQVVRADLVLNATGRVPFSEGLGLDELGVIRQRGQVQVNERMATTVPGIYAVGDVTGMGMLAHVASRQGEVAAEVIAGHDSRMDYHAVPYVVYSLPEIAGVGLTSQEAKEQGIQVEVGVFPFSANGRALTLGETEGQVRVLCEPGGGRVLGVHMMGPGVSDLIAEGTLAVQHGITARQMATTVHAHPTLSEAVGEAARAAAFGEALHFMKLRARG